MGDVIDLSKYRGMPPERQIATLFKPQKAEAEARGFKMKVKVDRIAPRDYEALVRLYPVAPRARSAMRKYGAECIEGAQKFDDPTHVAFAFQDAAKAAVELMRDAC